MIDRKLQEFSKSETLKAARAAASAEPDRVRPSGCGRVYVTFLGKVLKRHEEAFKAAGFRLTPCPGVKSKAIYIGYDNHDGRALGRGEAVTRVLRGYGLPAISEAQAD